MILIARIFAAILFVLFFGFALKNAHEVTLRLFFDNELHTPLALLLLAFFAAGAIFGVLGMTLTLFRKRRELTKCQKALDAIQKKLETQKSNQNQAPQADGIADT
jgi:lipopolysaccharide assembly protein A